MEESKPIKKREFIQKVCDPLSMHIQSDSQGITCKNNKW